MSASSSASHRRGSVTELLATTLDRLAAGALPQAETQVSASAQAQTGGRQKRKARSAGGPQTSLGALIEALDERAFGLMLLILALPCCVPFIYGLPQIVAVPMLALAAQLAAGRDTPWLPERLRARQFEVATLQSAVSKAERYLGWLERLAVPRLTALTTGSGARIVGLLLLIPTASILVPLPSTNTMPGIGVAIASVGLIERDGLLVGLGLVVGLAWVALLVTAFTIFGAEGIEIVKDFIKSLL